MVVALDDIQEFADRVEAFARTQALSVSALIRFAVNRYMQHDNSAPAEPAHTSPTPRRMPAPVAAPPTTRPSPFSPSVPDDVIEDDEAWLKYITPRHPWEAPNPFVAKPIPQIPFTGETVRWTTVCDVMVLNHDPATMGRWSVIASRTDLHEETVRQICALQSADALIVEDEWATKHQAYCEEREGNAPPPPKKPVAPPVAKRKQPVPQPKLKKIRRPA